MITYLTKMDKAVKGRAAILRHNPDKFLEDLKLVREVLVYAHVTKCFLETTKRRVLELAETKKITYYMTDGIFVVKRTVMVII